MPCKRFTNEQTAFALRQAENGATVDEICRKMGVFEPTFYRWKKQFVGMGMPENHKRTYRLYRDEGLSIRSKLPKRKRAWRYRQGRPAIGGPNEVWAMDFVSGPLFDERSFRILTVVDCRTREALSLTPRANFRA